MAKRAVFTLTRSPDASTFEFSFFSPKVPASLGPEAFTFTIDGERVRRCCYGAGLHVLDIPLPVASAGSSGSSGATTITVDAKYAFVPAKYGMNGDVRALSVMVKRVAIQ